MLRIAAALLAWMLAAPVLAQQVFNPKDSSIVCGYNSSLPILASGTYGLVQCNPNGALFITNSASNPLSVIPGGSAVSSYAEVSITTGGTAQNLFGGVAPVNGYEVINNSPSPCWWREGGTATGVAPSTQLAGGPGVSYKTPFGYKPQGIVNVYCSDTSHSLTTRGW